MFTNEEKEEIINNINKAENIIIVRFNKFRKDVFFTLRDNKEERGYSIHLYLSNRKRIAHLFRYRGDIECIKRAYEACADLRFSVKEILALIKGREIK